MSVSAIFGTKMGVATKNVEVGVGVRQVATTSGGVVTVIECSSRPQKKATAHHMKSRPKKTQPWDIRRRPTVYEPLPPLPADWTFVSSGGSDEAEAEAEAGVQVQSSAPLPADS